MNRLYSVRASRMIAILALVYMGYYLWWRVTSTLNSGALVFSVLFIVAEAIGVANFLLFVFMTWELHHPLPVKHQTGLKVDIYIPTYNEDIEILEATLIGCTAISYPHTTYVLDDGRRPAVADLAERLGCRYLTRSDNLHAKAGNINAALPHTDGDFIAMFDGDTVPQPDFLDRTLGYFVDERVALVQTPQEFYNQDSVQHVREDEKSLPWHEQALFYRVIQPGKNRWNAAFWCGSPSVVRRSALEAVGGVATETVTEDIHTSIRLHTQGWKTVFHNETLAYGIAPQTLEAFTVQRLRWAQGAMQLLQSSENPIVISGLSLAQRLNYIASMFTYFESYQKLVYVLAPVIVLLTGALPFISSGQDFIVHWLPFFALGILANVALGQGNFHYLRVEKYNYLKLFTFVWASTILVWPRRLRFHVTPKNANDLVRPQERRLLMPQIVLVGVELLAVLIGIANLQWGVTTTYSNVGRSIATVALLWVLVNVGVMVLGMSSIARRIYRRQDYRFPIQLDVTVTPEGRPAAAALLQDVSRTGVGLVSASSLDSGCPISVTLQLPEGPLSVKGEVAHLRPLSDKTWKVGVSFFELAPAERQRLVEFLFVTIPRFQESQSRRRSGADRTIGSRDTSILDLSA